MIRRFDVYTDELKVPTTPKNAVHRYIYLFEYDKNPSHFTSYIVERSYNGFTDVDFEDNHKWYEDGDDTPKISFPQEEADESNPNRNPDVLH